MKLLKLFLKSLADDSDKYDIRSWKDEYLNSNKESRLDLRKEYPEREDLYDSWDKLLK